MSKTNDSDQDQQTSSNTNQEAAYCLYTLLNLNPQTATYEDIQRSYKRTTLIFHPDKQLVLEDKVTAQTSFLFVKQAHDILSDDIYKIAYDQFGVAAVNIVKRSQQQRSQQQARDKNSQKNENDNDNDNEESSPHDDDENDDNNDNGNDDTDKDLYQTLKEATPEQAVLILQQAMDESEQDKHASSPHFDASIDLPWRIHYDDYDNGNNSNNINNRLPIERDTAQVQFHCRSQPTPHLQANVSATSSMQRTAETDIALSAGLNYQPAPASSVDVNVNMNHQPQSMPQVSLRTQRQLASGTVASIAVGGSLKSYQTWTYSASSFRTLQFYKSSNSSKSSKRNKNKRSSNQEEPTKVQAFWRISLAATGTLQYAMASIRTMKFPQWRCRISSSALPLKVSYQQDAKASLYMAWSTVGVWSRIKIMTAFQWGRWKVRYGIKYDGGSQYTNGMPWTVVCKLQSSDWTIALPIGMMDPTDWPVVWLSTMMVSFWVDSQLEQLNINREIGGGGGHSHGKTSIPFAFNDSATNLSNALPYAEMIARVATKKKEMEALRPGGGLVILRAVVVADGDGDHNSGKKNKGDHQDVTNALQFWVVQSRLSLPIQERQSWWLQQQRTMEHTSKTSSLWTRVWCQLTGRPSRPSKKETEDAGAGVLTIRYRYGERVYEIVFEGDELIWLPNDRAKELGPASFVA
jgi:curved DNA-binding protein CbpA